MHHSENWQPFATAPEDGTEIIVWREDAGVFTAKYCPPSGIALWEPADPEFYCWFADGEDLTGDLPTLWRPLPPPPSEDERRVAR